MPVGYRMPSYVRGGCTWANVQVSAFGKNMNYAPLTNFSGGVVFYWALSDNFSIQPELGYQKKGVRYEKKGTSSLKGVATFHHLELPVLEKYKFNTEGSNF